MKTSELFEASTSFDITALKAAVEKETTRGHNSENLSADKSQDIAVNNTIRAITPFQSKEQGEALTFAQEKFEEAADNCEYAGDLSEIKQSRCWGTFIGWRAIVKFLGGKIEKKLAEVNSVYDFE